MKYMKKRVVIEAIQLKATNFDRICDFMGCTPTQIPNPMFDIDEFGDSRDTYIGIIINTLEGEMRANIGDMIIKGVHGEFYPCKPDIFAETYEKINDTNKNQKPPKTIILQLPITIKPTKTEPGYVIKDAAGIEHFFYDKGSLNLDYDGLGKQVSEDK